MAELRWGIMGTGGIAATMCQTLFAAGAEVVAVGSARPGAAARFAEFWDIPLAVDTHAGVANVPEVDVVYVATTNDRHLDNVLACIAHGKAVLCEKPIALNRGQTEQMFDAARRAGVLVVEAMWMSFLPFWERLGGLLAAEAVGEVRGVSASLSFVADEAWDRRWLNRELGGGALLDLGVYPLTLAHRVLGPATETVASAWMAPTGVDLTCRVISHHGQERGAGVTASLSAETGNEAVVAGTEGLIRIHPPFHHSTLLTVEHHGHVVSSHPCDYDGHGFRFEVEEVERCVRAGLTETPLRPHADTLAVMAWMDLIRAECGVVYPGDVE